MTSATYSNYTSLVVWEIACFDELRDELLKIFPQRIELLKMVQQRIGAAPEKQNYEISLKYPNLTEPFDLYITDSK